MSSEKNNEINGDKIMSENDSEQQMEIGKKLQKARQAKGYTLDDLQQITKIQKRYLIAIEDEKFDELPGDFYVRAFVKQYADTVGLDGQELLSEYDDDLPEAKTAEYSDHISQAVETRASQRKTVSNSVSKARQYLPTVIIACVIIVVLAAIWVTAIARSHRDSSTRIDNSSVSVSGESRKKESSSSVKKNVKKPTSSPIKLRESSRTTTGVVYSAGKLKKNTNLQVQTSSSSVVRVQGNNQVLFSRTMAANGKNSVKIAKSTTSLVITVTNPSATKITIGGKTINFTNSGKNQNTRTITINFGSQTASSSSSSSATTTQRNTTSTATTTRSGVATNGNTTTGTSNATTGRTTTTQGTTTNQGAATTTTGGAAQTTGGTR